MDVNDIGWPQLLSFDAGEFRAGRGSDDSSRRIDVVVRNPVPGGDRAVNDTKLSTDACRGSGRIFSASGNTRRNTWGF